MDQFTHLTLKPPIRKSGRPGHSPSGSLPSERIGFEDLVEFLASADNGSITLEKHPDGKFSVRENMVTGIYHQPIRPIWASVIGDGYTDEQYQEYRERKKERKAKRKGSNGKTHTGKNTLFAFVEVLIKSLDLECTLVHGADGVFYTYTLADGQVAYCHSNKHVVKILGPDGKFTYP